MGIRVQEVTRESRHLLITLSPSPLSHQASSSVAPRTKIINAAVVIPGPCSHGDEKPPPHPRGTPPHLRSSRRPKAV